ncbi:hypothetical protein, conserved [Babesia ovata]|uniref:Uncharacterized protein n=1 Tax=Babesia ovata TaxID=189622 RepID=A0A2H6KI50_9APIC|nr:uncharacterized protein BOVATA_041560 [Babesia ovata]GBE62663.1 hypothetical protein, conserved [Babesia ovata]
MAYNSLTEAPRNLKEAIDWLMALKGTDAENNMKAFGDAVYKFLADKPVGKMEVPALEKVKVITKQFLEHRNIKGQWFTKRFLKMYGAPMVKEPEKLAKVLEYVRESDHKNVVQTHKAKPETIAKKLGKVVAGCDVFLEHIKNPDSYNSAYSSEATWDASCTEDPEACAVVFVGIAPMLYTGLYYLQHACIRAKLGGPGSFDEKRYESALEAAGYDAAERHDNISASDLLWSLDYANKQALATIYDLSGFWAFY